MLWLGARHGARAVLSRTARPYELGALDASNAADAAGAGAQQRGGSEAGDTAGSPPQPRRQLRRVSGLGPAPSLAELRGGWRFTREVFDAATRIPGAAVLSWRSPRVVLLPRFLSSAERQHLVGLAEGRFVRSEVVSDGAAAVDPARTSHGVWLNGGLRDDAVLAVQHRIHSAVGIPEAFGESIYMLRYGGGQQYDQHWDHCWPDHGQPPPGEACREFLRRAGGPGCGPGAGGPTCGDRLATVILFLASPAAGGSTVFPSAHAAGRGGGGGSTAAARRELRPGQSGGDATEAPPGRRPPWYCRPGSGALGLTPQPGDALLFWDYVPGGEGSGGLAAPDPASMHSGCPVLQGAKLIATRWIRSAEFH